ncbi:MAG TPA: N-acetyltransferase [Rhizomicrobium sp.]|nr:N-acetyltransferase [Rhizomicrobium sp.]
MWEIREERAEDRAAIDALVEKSFGPGRFAKSAYRLREGVDPEADLSFVAIEDGALRGSNRFWPVIVGDMPALLLGPLAVETERRGRGMGIQLMQRGIDEARAKGHRAIILVGDLPYYSRVGFVPVKRGRVKLPGPVDLARLLGLSLVEGALEALEGPVKRARIDHPVCADGAALGKSRPV